MEDDPLSRLEAWYSAQCNDEWEHAYGIVIDTLDNPGWRLRVDLAETNLQDVEFTALMRETSPQDWIDCRVKNGAFEGYGAAANLKEIIRVFLDWADDCGSK